MKFPLFRSCPPEAEQLHPYRRAGSTEPHLSRSALLELGYRNTAQAVSTAQDYLQEKAQWKQIAYEMDLYMH